MTDLNIAAKDAEFLCQLLPGDILVMRADRDHASKIIRWWTSSKYSHTATYAGNGKLIEAVNYGVRELHWVETDYSNNYSIVALRKNGLTQDQVGAVLAFQRERVGCAYDFIKLLAISIIWMAKWFGLDLRKYKNCINISYMYLCVELITESYESIKITLVDDSVDKTQIIPADFVERGCGLEKVAEYIV